jgi:alpha-mannosidase
MRRFPATLVAILLSCPLLFTAVYAQTAEKPDLSMQPPLYVAGYAHLDTEWRWEYPQVIDEYIRKTMEDNFKLFDKYPHYVFNFSGANRYRLMKEYFPAAVARLKKYVDEGRWLPAGSSMEEGDVNAPSAEGIIRQILYGNDWLRKELGKASAEYTGRNDKPDSRPKAPSKLAYAGKSRPWRSRFRNDDGFCRPFLHYAENGGLQAA